MRGIALILSLVTSSAIADAVQQLMGGRAHMASDIHVIAGGAFAGPAVTLQLVRDDTASVTDAGLTAIKLIEASRAGSVVVAVLDDDKGFAVFGSTFAMLAKTRKLAGFVVDGSVRDVGDLRQIAFPTYARGTAPGSAGGHYRVEGADVTVRCGGIQVRPDDIVIADEDGVAVAPKERYDEILSVATKGQSDKQALLPLIAKYGSYMKAMQERDAASKRQP
jgi:regulator of RNase E activity RraA